MCNPLLLSRRYLSPNSMFGKGLLYFLCVNNCKVRNSTVVRFVLIVIIDHKTDHSAASCHSSGVEDTSGLQGCSVMPTGKQFNDFLMALPSPYLSMFSS